MLPYWFIATLHYYYLLQYFSYCIESKVKYITVIVPRLTSSVSWQYYLTVMEVKKIDIPLLKKNTKPPPLSSRAT